MQLGKETQPAMKTFSSVFWAKHFGLLCHLERYHSYTFTSGHLLFLERTPFLKIQKRGKNKIEVLITLASSNALFYSFGMFLPVSFSRILMFHIDPQAEADLVNSHRPATGKPCDDNR